MEPLFKVLGVCVCIQRTVCSTELQPDLIASSRPVTLLSTRMQARLSLRVQQRANVRRRRINKRPWRYKRVQKLF